MHKQMRKIAALAAVLWLRSLGMFPLRAAVVDRLIARSLLSVREAPAPAEPIGIDPEKQKQVRQKEGGSDE